MQVCNCQETKRLLDGIQSPACDVCQANQQAAKEERERRLAALSYKYQMDEILLVRNKL